MKKPSKKKIAEASKKIDEAFKQMRKEERKRRRVYVELNTVTDEIVIKIPGRYGAKLREWFADPKHDLDSLPALYAKMVERRPLIVQYTPSPVEYEKD